MLLCASSTAALGSVYVLCSSDWQSTTPQHLTKAVSVYMLLYASSTADLGSVCVLLQWLTVYKYIGWISRLSSLSECQCQPIGLILSCAKFEFNFYFMVPFCNCVSSSLDVFAHLVTCVGFLCLPTSPDESVSDETALHHCSCLSGCSFFSRLLRNLWFRSVSSNSVHVLRIKTILSVELFPTNNLPSCLIRLLRIYGTKYSSMQFAF